MSLLSVFDVAGSGMSAQALRLNVVASNLANADAVAGNSSQVYRARHPVFAAQTPRFVDVMQDFNAQSLTGVRVAGIVESDAPPHRRYQPGHPLADDEGYVLHANVNTIEEMANMMSASRSYQTNVELINTSKQLLLRTLALGQ